MRPGAVVLAAGASRRLGRPKQLEQPHGVPLVRQAAASAIAAGCEPVIAVLGARADEVAQALEGLDLVVVVHPGFAEGMGSTIRAGITALRARSPRASGVVVLGCDQPALDGRVLERLREAWSGEPRGLAACGYAETVGSPALFGRGWFPDLLALDGDRGARSLLERHRAEVRVVDWPDGARDVDRPEDLERSGRSG